MVNGSGHDHSGEETQLMELDRYRKLDVSEPVTVTLPAHVWIGFISAYLSADDWANCDTSAICSAAQRELLDPIYVNERDAAHQQHKDMHEKAVHRMFGVGNPLDPNDPRNGQ
jgi:hypothetical protein